MGSYDVFNRVNVMSGEEEDGIPWFEVKVPPTKLSFSQNVSA